MLLALQQLPVLRLANSPVPSRRLHTAYFSCACGHEWTSSSVHGQPETCPLCRRDRVLSTPILGVVMGDDTDADAADAGHEQDPLSDAFSDHEESD
jgi:hypothetical protein